MSGGNHVKTAIESLLDFAIESGQIVLEEGLTEQAAEQILKAAFDAAWAAVPNPVVNIGGTDVEVPVGEMVRLLEPAVVAAIDALTDALSPQRADIVVTPGVTVRWVIEKD